MIEVEVYYSVSMMIFEYFLNIYLSNRILINVFKINS